MGPSAYESRFIEVSERVCSVLSLISTSVIIGTFVSSNLFRKPINRLVFYASWGNIMSNVATMISVAGYAHGTGTSLCQVQGFLIQWFMPADALWAFAMALNVYLTFFHKFDSSQLRKLEWKYFVACYGIPFVPAFIYCFVDTPAKGKIYGEAVLWCWVSLKWDALRIATFYGPVWFILVLTFAIYIRAGKVIFEKRRQLQSANTNTIGSSYFIDDPFQEGAKLTEIRVTTEQVVTSSVGSTQPMEISADRGRVPGTSDYSPYSIKIETGPHMEKEEIPMQPLPPVPQTGNVNFRRQVAAVESNKAAWAYTKCAMLFFIALVITWVPSSLNRLYTLVYPDGESMGLDYASAIVLPLQGLWNGLIYVAVSWPSVKTVIANVRQASRPYPIRITAANGNLDAPNFRRQDSDSNESTTELAMHPQPKGSV
ncbi:hypothetical protein DTO164E3_198 [Paecilomyces variotii]|nr:hypothetical protein DTO164E3_198 [Paecilomyces variotii]KAJ9227391.1 hypothetical protein DTO169C6_32 [Paecilomyces variotii]KAJ9246122.1 hypothetical protein DTO169E5_246 [Paecilomyces variotii]KAJ9357114.1 hypothetical protein DTO027B9_3253 [Paecilomyces variotii]KAJ9379161.1 hypothetical protein DTO063F5_7260 [Paecilomyces variotii]